MTKKFKHIEPPYGFRDFYSKYPHGYSIYEALLEWVQQVNELTDFVSDIPANLESYTQEQLTEWLNDGTLEGIINTSIMNDKVDKNTLRYSLDDFLSDNLTTTEALQLALNTASGSILHIPNGTFTIKQVLVPSNIVIEMSPGTVIIADSSYEWEWHNPLIDIRLVKNVTINGNGATIKMIKEDYTTEHSHCLGIRGSKNVVITGLTLREAGGDGIYIDGMDGSSVGHSENITIKDCIMDGNRRQGLSLLGARNLLVENCDFNNTVGTAPQSGVDIEPELANTALDNITFSNCRSNNNQYVGFLVALQFINPAIPVDITFINCVDRNSKGFMVNGIKENTKGQIRFIECKSFNSYVAGFLDYSNHPQGVERIYKNCSVYNHNTGNFQPDETHAGEYGYGSAFLAEIGNKPGIGNITFDGCYSDSANTYYGIAFKSNGSTNEQHGKVVIKDYNINRYQFNTINMATWRYDNMNLKNTKENVVKTRDNIKHLNALFSVITSSDSNSWFELPDNYIEGAVIEYLHTFNRVAKFYTPGGAKPVHPYTTPEAPALLLHKKGDRIRLTYRGGSWYCEVLAGTPTINII